MSLVRCKRELAEQHLDLVSLLTATKSYRQAAGLWISYLRLWHRHSILGLENIPVEGRGRVLHSHWSRTYITALSLVESLPSVVCASSLLP